MTIFSKTENNAIKNRGNRGFWRWIAKMSKMVRYGGREKRGRRDWAGGAPPCRSPVADRICTSRAHGEKFSILAQVVKGRNEVWGAAESHGLIGVGGMLVSTNVPLVWMARQKFWPAAIATMLLRPAARST